MTGRIIHLNKSKQYGAIEGADGIDRPFLRSGLVVWGAFDDMKVGDLVLFDDEQGRAVNVEPALGMPAG